MEGILEEAGGELVRRAPQAGESVRKCRGLRSRPMDGAGGTSLASLNLGSRPRLLSV